MKQVITAKLKLQTTPEHFRALRATQLAYRDALEERLICGKIVRFTYTL